jgi:hypothetical protein
LTCHFVGVHARRCCPSAARDAARFRGLDDQDLDGAVMLGRVRPTATTRREAGCHLEQLLAIEPQQDLGRRVLGR